MIAGVDVRAEYGRTGRLDELRRTEYGYLDEQGHLYLDYTGAGLAARAQLRAHADRLGGTLFGNPHSVNPTSEAATELVERTRARVLRHLNADPAEYAAVFTANATGAARLVGEAYPFSRRTRLVLTFDNHNSVNGLREFARRGHAATSYVPTEPPELRVDTEVLAAELARHGGGLFAFPAQSNFSGVRHPLDWIELAHGFGYDVLLDAAAYLPTARLDLTAVRPDFVLVSWYKLFGYPTGVGCLVARREALARLARPWFSGGTIQAVSVGLPWHTMTADESAFEDGTLNFLCIPDVHVGIDWLDGIGVELVGTRVRCLTGWLLERLTALRHGDGSPMVEVYGPVDTRARGGTVAFNLRDRHGRIVDERLVAAETAAAGISLRTGCFCNPGVGENAFGLGRDALLVLRDARPDTLDEYLALVGLPSAGALRVSFGLASTVDDLDRFVAFVERTYRDRVAEGTDLPPRDRC
ncbi:aminotransferase class V-fold PLP-dependent enzyme [Actinophytocola gossypii]|uniref:Aminotransferase class V-fold PLP-dependent enzyme n=1 Tax=Actinophytocola gossypii TaxID=2812003 RepID=A0ABT2J2J8_9PSEU|nr:aminotransferase class V-fold PLP-dependent enzyme [Actinophytocola gossypii]MCT2582033.1 aminotransferase class V-fold PLP-dependent enzyme [Actinophytocola gossypii]